MRATDGPEQAWRRWRAVRYDLFRDHPQSPSPGYTGLDYFPYDPALRLLVHVEPAEEELREIAGSAGSLTTFRCFGRALNPSCAYDGRWACPLTPPGNGLAGELRAGEKAPPAPNG